MLPASPRCSQVQAHLPLQAQWLVLCKALLGSLKHQEFTVYGGMSWSLTFNSVLSHMWCVRWLGHTITADSVARACTPRTCRSCGAGRSLLWGEVRTIQDKPALRDVGLRVLENSEGCVEWKDSFTRHHF